MWGDGRDPRTKVRLGDLCVPHFGAHRGWMDLYSPHRHFLTPVLCRAWRAVDTAARLTHCPGVGAPRAPWAAGERSVNELLMPSGVGFWILPGVTPDAGGEALTVSLCVPPLAKFGANAILGISLAVCKAGAAEKGVPLYRHIADLAGNPDLVLPVPVSAAALAGCHSG